MRAGLGNGPYRYGDRCWPQALRPVCARMDPVVVVTVHRGGEVRIDGCRWQRDSPSGDPVVRTGRPDERGHAIFRHLVDDDGTGGAWFFAGTSSVRCDSGAELQAAIAELHLRDAQHQKRDAAALAWVFADCRGGTIATMRNRYPFLGT